MTYTVKDLIADIEHLERMSPDVKLILKTSNQHSEQVEIDIKKFGANSVAEYIALLSKVNENFTRMSAPKVKAEKGAKK
jgi:hypothetical protein